MPEIRDYKRSKKLYQSDNFVFVKPRYWPEEVPIDGTDVVVRKEDPMKLRGEVVGYQYVIEDYGEYDPSVPESDVYEGYSDPPVGANGYVSERNWPQTIDLPDGTILRKTRRGSGERRYAYYYVDSWGPDSDPSLPESPGYEGEFDKEY